jgi:tetratricopeptide (TPR) repeat protein
VYYFVPFCSGCGNSLASGNKFCPICGTSVGGAEEERVIRIGNTSGRITGAGVSGIGHKIGDTYIEKIENMTLLVASPGFQPKLNDLVSMPIKLTPITTSDQQLHINKVEAEHNKEELSGFLRKIEEIDEQEGTHIEHIKAGDLQISRGELQLKEVIAEGNQHYYEGEYSKALECYDEAIEIDDKHAGAWYNKGLVLDNLGRYNEAMTAYRKSIELDDSFPAVWTNMSYLSIKAGRYYEGIEYANKTIMLDAYDGDGYYNRACAECRIGKVNECLSDLEWAIKLDKKYAVIAKEDEDFNTIKDIEEFKLLLSRQNNP